MNTNVTTATVNLIFYTSREQSRKMFFAPSAIHPIIKNCFPHSVLLIHHQALPEIIVRPELAVYLNPGDAHRECAGSTKRKEVNMYLRKILYVILPFMLTISCAQQSKNSITVEQLNNEITSDSNLVILDVRTPAELTGSLGKIEDVINIPIQELESRIDELEKYKDRNIAVICRTGRRSAIGTDILIKNGFKAKNVLGGMVEFRQFEKQK